MHHIRQVENISEDEKGVHAAAHAGSARFFEYSKAANPIRPDLTPPVPYHFFPPSLYADGPSRVVPLDQSAALKCASPATGPDLCANFIRIIANEEINLDVNATSLVFYALSGNGSAEIGSTSLEWKKGDFFTAPGGVVTNLTASVDATLYYVNDAPLLTYLGVKVDGPRFAPTLYDGKRAESELDKAINDPEASKHSRISVLLANDEFPLTRTVTHVLWAMYGIIGANTEQKPHRHQSIALDLIVECEPGRYSLVGTKVDEKGDIIDPVKVEWESGCAFITPPGYWHAHFNRSGKAAHLIPIQDAGLQTYMRTLDIRFT